MKKINNLKVRKEVYKIGSTILTTMMLSGLFGCSKPNVEVEPTSVVEPTDIELTPEITPEPTIEATPEITPTPEPTPYDPYNLTEADAVMMGKKLYDDWIIQFKQSNCSMRYDILNWTWKDMTNHICLYGGIEPLYPELRSACSDGDIIWLVGFSGVCESFAIWGANVGNQLILLPQSWLYKEGRKEQIYLKEIEDNFRYLIDNEVSDEEIYEHWGKIIRFVIDKPLEGELSKKDIDIFNWCPLYSTFLIQSECMRGFSYGDTLNGIMDIPLKYIYPDRYQDSKVSFSIDSMFYEREYADQFSHKGIKGEDYEELASCFWRFAEQHSKNYHNNSEEDGYYLRKAQ